jgi:hypothetical protein
MLKKINEKYSNKKLLEDELLNAKLFDNYSFQYILDRELHRRTKSENTKKSQTLK